MHLLTGLVEISPLFLIQLYGFKKRLEITGSKALHNKKRKKEEKKKEIQSVAYSSEKLNLSFWYTNDSLQL